MLPAAAWPGRAHARARARRARPFLMNMLSLTQADPAPSSTPATPLLDTAAGLTAFDLGPILGTGSFGRVRLARHKATGQPVALKALSKAHLVRHGQVAHLRSERDVLLTLEGPAYVRLLGVFQVRERRERKRREREKRGEEKRREGMPHALCPPSFFLSQHLPQRVSHLLPCHLI